MAVLITGGAGFIGSNFVADWLSVTDEPVINIDKLNYAGSLQNISGFQNDLRHIFVRGDMGDQVLVEEICRKYTPRAVINFAAQTHVNSSIGNPTLFIDNNIVRSASFLDSIYRYWEDRPSVQKQDFKFLQISTDEVYGDLGPHDASFTEEHPFKPNNPYSASKASFDHILRAYYKTYGFPVLTTHCSNNYGPHQNAEKLIPSMISCAIAGQNLRVYGDGMNVRDWLYVRDHCQALRLVLEKGAPGQTYNIGGNGEKTNIDIVHEICDILDELAPNANGASYREQITFVEDRKGHDRRYSIDSSKLYVQMQWSAQTDLAQGLRQTVAWYLKHLSRDHDAAGSAAAGLECGT